jgi:hypothetical protein
MTEPLTETLRLACATKDPEYRAMARNLLAEHRVPADRFAGFLKDAGSLANLDRVRDALNWYQVNEVRPNIKGGAQPAYERPENAENAVALTAKTRLATVLDLTRLGRVWAEASTGFHMDAFRFIQPTAPSPDEVNEFLAPRLGTTANAEAFLPHLFEALKQYRNKTAKRIDPTWAAEWESLKPFLDPNHPQRWLQAVGVPKDIAVWLAVVCYPATRVERIFRPTQLDAGWYAHHFPSPPQAATAAGGHTMFLHSAAGVVATHDGLVSEYIHVQADFTLEDWRVAGRLVGFAPLSAGVLDDQRLAHWQLLQRKYDETQVRLWMPDFP